MKQLNAVVSCMCLGLALATPTWAQTEQHDHGAKPGAIKAGTVNFETSCNPAVKDDFNLAVAELHSFWFPEARVHLRGRPEERSQLRHCVLGHRADVLGQSVRRPAIAADHRQRQGGDRQGPDHRPPTPREKGYIDAVAGLFSSADVTTQRARVVAYEGATELVASQNPDDMEARIFWALAIAQTALPTDKTFAQNLKAAEILEPLYKKNPNHPGLAHYIIHSYDVPALAAKALPAARAYADIAPSVPHALHMPSHTFTRVGEWKESVATNIKSAAEAEKTGGGRRRAARVDYKTYAYLQMAMDKEAKGVARSRDEGDRGGARRTVRRRRDPATNTFAIAAIPARYAMERQQWADAAMLKPTPAPNTPYTEAITHFARAIGAAARGQARRRGGRHRAARRDSRSRNRDEGRLLGGAGRHPAPRRRGVGDVRRRQEGRGRSRPLTAAADAEDLTDKSAVTPGPLAPARELLGFMLLEAGRAKDALVAFEAVTKKEPNRFLALYGARQGRRGDQADDEGQGLLPADRRDLQGRVARSARARLRAKDGGRAGADRKEVRTAALGNEKGRGFVPRPFLHSRASALVM